MLSFDLEQAAHIAVFCALPGAAGGLGTFLHSLKNGHYKNNRFVKKLLLEMTGATLVATFLAPLFPSNAQMYLSFAVGLAWASLIQVLRDRITRIVEAALSDSSTNSK